MLQCGDRGFDCGVEFLHSVWLILRYVKAGNYMRVCRTIPNPHLKLNYHSDRLQISVVAQNRYTSRNLIFPSPYDHFLFVIGHKFWGIRSGSKSTVGVGAKKNYEHPLEIHTLTGRRKYYRPAVLA